VTAGGSGACWICGGATELESRGRAVTALAVQSFQITDSEYGEAADIHRCRDCGFRMCFGLENVLEFYRDLVDPEYEAGRAERSLQMRRLLQTVLERGEFGPREHPLRLLDVGAGSGILVEGARAMGLDADGVEPSRWLAEIAEGRGLPVRRGDLSVLPPDARYDVITLIDVIEHVPDPRGLVDEAARHLADRGILAIVTPDLGSVPARILGRRWWHVRMAHIGYFSNASMQALLDRTNLRRAATLRPWWYFRFPYLFERLQKFVLGRIVVRSPRALENVVVPLNLLDSMLVLARRAD